MKGTVKLTEQDLRGIVKESVKKILKEDNPPIYNPDLLEARKRSVLLVNQIADLVHDLFTETEGNDARFHRVADSLLSTLEKYGLQEGYKYPYCTNESKTNRIVKESVKSVNSISLPRKGWKMLAISKLNIKYNGRLVYVIENRPKDGEVWLLTQEYDGYHVIGYFSDLESSQQEAIKQLLMQRMSEM